MAEKKTEKISKKTVKKERRVEPTLPGGFRDYGPAEAIARAQMLQTIRATFENFGFDPMETSSVQRKDVLFGGEKESEKIIFDVKGSREKKSDTALRFDLTVPFARFMAANPEIPKPFKRYQIGTVWRGESPQAGRYREFMQADIDIIGSSSINADAEVIAVIYQTLKNLGIDDFVIKINNRKIFQAFPKIGEFEKERLWEYLRILDKKDKIGVAGVDAETKKVFGKKTSDLMRQFFDFKKDEKNIIQLRVGDVVTQEATRELSEIKENLELLGINNKYYEFDISVVRGLGYYTGTIFETILTKIAEIGSIFSGGRYDNLVSEFTGQNIPAVGASIGIDRLFAAQEKLGLIKKQQTVTKVLVLNLLPELASDYLQIAKQLRDATINTSFYLGDDTSFQAQLSYAVKKEISFVVIYGDEEKKKGVVAVKNLSTREQKEIKREELAAFFKK